MLKKLKQVDIFYKKVDLRLDGHKNHRTYAGAAITIILTFIAIAVFYRMLDIYFENKYSKIDYFEQWKLEKKDSLNLAENFFFALSFNFH